MGDDGKERVIFTGDGESARTEEGRRRYRDPNGIYYARIVSAPISRRKRKNHG